MYKLPFLMFLFIALTTPFFSSCHKQKNHKEKSEEKGRKKAELIPVKSVIVKIKKLPRHIEVVTSLLGRKQVDVAPQVAGKISLLGPKEGSYIKKGDLLFQIDRSDPSESFLATPVLSPITGWVGRWITPNLGAYVNTQDPVVTLVDDEELKAFVSLPITEWLLISRSTPAFFSFGQEKVKASITSVSRSADAASSRGTVTVEVNNKHHRWKSGMVVLVTFDLEIRPRIVVPASALSITDQGTFVYLIKEDIAKKTPVTFALLDNDNVEITSSLEEDSELVIQGVNQLAEGLAIKLIKDEKKSL